MTSPAPVLAVVDPTVSIAAGTQPAIERAAALALAIHAPLVLLACVFDPYIAGEQMYPGIDLRKLRRASLDHQLSTLRPAAEALRARGIDVSCRAVFDHPLHEGIVREAMRLSPVVVVKDTHSHSVLARTIYSNTDWHLIRECPAPLWLVKPVETRGQAVVLAAVDPLHRNDKPAVLDKKIIEIARELARTFGNRVHLGHAISIQFPGPGAALPAAAAIPSAIQPEVEAQIRREHAEALERLAADTGFPAEQVHLRRGDAADAIPRLAADLNAAVVVMGAVSRSRLKRVFIGHTAEKVLEALPCDALIVKPEGFFSPVSTRARAAGYMARTGR